MKSVLLVCAGFLLSAVSFADEARMGPVFEDYGPVYDVDDMDFPLDADASYRVVFDAAAYSVEGTGLNRELESVARFINMHAANGVSPDRMRLVVVLHGEALKSALLDDAYRERYQRDNPNLDLVKQLAGVGVRFVACGQSLGFREFDRDELAESVEVALSAMTALTVLQSEGYALIP